jgi:hypothetical protein
MSDSLSTPAENGVSPMMRFHAHDILNLVAERGSKFYAAARAATLWESFPKSYTERQVQVAQALLIELAKQDLDELRTRNYRSELITALLRVQREML